MAGEAAPIQPASEVARKRHRYARAMNIGAAGLAVIVLTIAFVLHPDARGHGTHEALGLPPCTMLLLTGIPCPFCGMTTSYAHMAHGHFLQGFLTQPMGAVLFLMTIASVFFFIRRASAAEPIPPDEVISEVPTWGWILFGIGLVAAWIYKTIIILSA